MNLFNGFFGGHGGDGRGDNDCCSLILIWLLLSKCGCNFNICDLFTCENLKMFVLIFLLINMCGGHDTCGCRG
ncbi:MAG: hypothetical protein IJ318_03835 [Clostridia bacterium]|nr:hypothetical protein [Clostridia bacterium]